MGQIESVRFRWIRVALALVLVGFLCPTWAQVAKAARQNMDALAFTRPQLRLSETLSEAESIANRLENVADMDRFRSEYGPAWHFLMDERTGRVNLLEGGAIPFIPGPANALRWEDFTESSCHGASCIPLSKLEGLARDFLAKHQSIFKVSQDELVLDPQGSVPVGDSIYYLRFQWVHGGVPVEGASIFFAINNGNLIQVGATRFGDIRLYTVPTISTDTAWQIVSSYVGGMDSSDEIANPGSLAIMPITPRGMDPDTFNVGFGQMIDYTLVYKLAFHRPGVMGTWEALVDAHTGEIIRFVDSNEYGHVQGGVYKSDKPQTEVTVPLLYVDYGASSFCDAAGNFAGTSGTSTMNGRTGSPGNVGGVYITDVCGSISRGANGSGLIDFGAGGGTDCTTPGVGGAGNTHAARTQYWNVTEIKIKAYSYLPTNAWLQGHLQDEVNENQTCNAYWDGAKLNFFHQGAGGCANTGELPGVSLHEWGHGMDSNDGSGGGNLPIESRADWTALLQTHQSCTGSGFYLSGICGGYGDTCLSCTGIRDADYAQHTHPTPWTPQNIGGSDPGYNCSTSCTNCYYGPCGYEDHCESGIATQARWDFVNRDLVGAPTNMDLVSAWQLADRLFYTSMPQAVNMYTCTRHSPPANTVSSGCGAGTIYTTYRAVDDDGDGVANGTPHAAAIFASLNRHNIACGAVGDAANQNETSCPALTTPTLSGSAGNSQNVLNWTTGGANATRYFVFRNETGCSAGFTRIATVAAPTLTYTDTSCYNGVTYYYRIQALTANDSCASVMSNCTTFTPSVCASTTIVVSPSSLSQGTAGVAYTSVVFSQTGGTGAIAWSEAGALPTGMSFTAATATLAGTPTVVGSFPITVTATDSNGCTGHQNLTLTIVCPTIAVSPSSLATGTAGVAYTPVTFSETSGVGTITWNEAGALPTGMGFNAATATLSGTPTQTGTFPITVTATDSNSCTGHQNLTLTVVCPVITLSPASPLPGGIVAYAYSQSVTASGSTGTYTYAVTAGTVPPGLSLSPGGVLSGTAAAAGVFSFTITATDTYACTGSRAYTVKIVPYDMSFFDDAGTSQVCVNSITGFWQWNILKGTGIGKSYSSTGVLVKTGVGFTISSKVLESNWAMRIQYYKQVHQASGFFTYAAKGISSNLTDQSTLNDPPGCIGY